MDLRRSAPLLCWFTVFAALLACKNSAKSDPQGASSPGQTIPAGGKVPPDGKYEHVTVEGRVVPMIHVMNDGVVVLVDTDGKKPRDWEEQFKRKGAAPSGTYNIHKTNANHNDAFDDDAIDREGWWTIDEKGTITQR